MRSVKGKWDYYENGMVCYSDPSCESYKKSATFLGDSVEDWGCGTGWAKKYFKNYRGIDGSSHPNVDEVVDLLEYVSDVDNILLRQVLELNFEWKIILENVKKSFSKKLCLIIFTPFSEKTHVMEISERGIPSISFNKMDILSYFPLDQYKIKEELVETKQGYGQDYIFYIEKI